MKIAVVGAGGVKRVLHPPMSQDEQQGLRVITQALRTAAGSLHP